MTERKILTVLCCLVILCCNLTGSLAINETEHTHEDSKVVLSAEFNRKFIAVEELPTTAARDVRFAAVLIPDSF